MTPPAADVPKRFARAAGGLTLVAAVAVVYANSLDVPLVLDDATTIVNNPSIRNLAALGQVLFPPPEIYSAGRPLLNLSFALNYAFGGTAVTGYHVVNAALHALAGLVLFGLTRRTIELARNVRAASARGGAPGRPPAGVAPEIIALVIAIVWVAHPVQTASVTYVSQRAESLMGLFYLLTLYGFVRAVTESSRGWFAVAVLACACGMATKEVMVTAPLLALLYDRQFVSGTLRAAWTRHRRILCALAATWVVLAALMLGSQVSQRGIGLGHNLDRLDYLRIETRAVLHYLRVCFWPEPLIFDFGPQLAVPAGAELAARGLAVLLLLAGSVVAFWRGRAVGFLGLGFLLLLAPTSSLVPVAGQPIAENRVYLPLALAVAGAVVGVFSILGNRAAALAVIALLPLGGLTHRRNEVLRDEVRLWADTLQKQPMNVRALTYLTFAQIAAGQPDRAIATMRAGIERMPGIPELHNNLGVYLYQAGRMTEALQHLREAVRLNPKQGSARLSLGQVLLAAGDPGGAAGEFAAAAALNPRDATAHNFLGLALVRAGRAAEAIPHFQAALTLKPDFAEARANLDAVRGAK